MPDKGWKQFERRAASIFGTVRTSLSGGNGKVTRSDTHHLRFFADCKLSRKFAHHSLFQEIARRAKVESKIPVLLTQKSNCPSFLVTVDKDDLVEFCKVYLEGRGYKIVRKP